MTKNTFIIQNQHPTIPMAKWDALGTAPRSFSLDLYINSYVNSLDSVDLSTTHPMNVQVTELQLDIDWPCTLVDGKHGHS